VALALAGCATVGLQDDGRNRYNEHRRDNVLTSGRTSLSTVQTLTASGLSLEQCRRSLPECTRTLHGNEALTEEMRLAAQAELWLGSALQVDARTRATRRERALDSYVESARAAYGYLFLTGREAEDRSFDLRHAQTVEIYNYAVKQAIGAFFGPRLSGTAHIAWPVDRSGWTWLRPDSDVVLGEGESIPAELISADDLHFKGIRSDYRRDGLGATFVAARSAGATARGVHRPWREPEYVPLTGLLTFPGADLVDVLSTRQVQVVARDPFADYRIEINGRRVPIAGNFTAPYGLWMARSGFKNQGRRALIGRNRSLTHPQILLMRPFDPHRRIVVMIHGLASSPEAWLNVANAMVGFDEELRRRYQIWQVYYPTNVPIAVNRREIQDALEAALNHYDPARMTDATRDMVLIGHSMGGVIGRLLVSTSNEELWRAIPVRADLPSERQAALRENLRPYFSFEAMPEFTRAIFVAAPHKGTPKARISAARWVRDLIRLPEDLLRQNEGLIEAMRQAAPPGTPFRLPTSIDNLSDRDAFILAASRLPISPAVTYHSILGDLGDETGLIENGSDGLVPYWSSHLNGAESERVFRSSHKVQDLPAAMLETRRILHLHLSAVDTFSP
jgi:pimeloyl-ACP methyl ester carboxylesterase